MAEADLRHRIGRLLSGFKRKRLQEIEARMV